MTFEPRQKTKANAAIHGISAFAMVIGFGNPLIARASEQGVVKHPTSIPSDIYSVFSPDGKWVAGWLSSVDDPTSDEKKTFAITIREVKGAKLKREIELQTKPGMIAWSPDCKLIVYSLPSSIIVLDAHSLSEIAKIQTNSVKALDFCWSPDKKHFAYADDGTIHILDAITMIERVKIDGATNGRFRLAWSPDSNYILLSAGETAAICDIKSGKYLGYKHWQDTRSHTISPDQNNLIIETINKLTTHERLTLPPKSDMSPFDKGKVGSPGWENNATPKTIEEAFAEFDKDLIQANRQRFKRAAQSDVGNFGGRESITDTMMADVYYKWNFTPLYKFFEARGITKERDVLGILLDSYWLHLNDKPIDLDIQISTHKAYWDDQKTVIAPNKQLPEAIWLCPLKTSSGTEYSLSTIKAKLQIVAFLMADDFSNAAVIKALKDLPNNHPTKDLAITVCVIPASSITGSEGSVESNNKSAEPCKLLEKLMQDSKGITVTEAPPQLTRAFFRMLKTKHTQFGPPQTFFISESGLLKYRVQRTDIGSTSKIFEKLVKKSL
ncbi:MAG: WD40 repeat domain-containing protein [Candidatus Obscuribacter sp.]|nr:WD40 repeat domain-containing protein [Candidatus Obscuribacter sp.]